MEIQSNFFYILLIFYGFLFVRPSSSNKVAEFEGKDSVLVEDILWPYPSWPASTRHHRTVRSIISKHNYGSLPHEAYPSPTNSPRYPLFQTYPFVTKVGSYWEERQVAGHYFVVPYPAETFSVLEPGKSGGCADEHRATVQDTGRNFGCMLATNAGFFNTTSGGCIGNVVSNGKQAHRATYGQNVHFGIRSDGNLFYGYLPGNTDIESEFSQLISGIIWLVRDGANYVDVSEEIESGDFQTTGSLAHFISVNSARLAVGNDKQGRVVIVQVDGKTGIRGINLREFADLLVSWDIVNAINLDGGGSVSAVVNGTNVNYPSDEITTKGSQPETHSVYRTVSTVLCVHEPVCSPPDCSGHGVCKLGRCYCRGNWEGPRCDSLECGHLNCSGHGECTAAGCQCFSGWYGDNCNKLCPVGLFGPGCSAMCRCGVNGLCDPIDGRCHCKSGYTGIGCDRECEPGSYGPRCRLLCYCVNSCMCHHVTGNCNVSMKSSKYAQVGYCLADQLIDQRHLVEDHPDQHRMWLVAVIVLSLVAATSLIINISLIGITYYHDCDSPTTTVHRRGSRRNRIYRAAILEHSSSEENLNVNLEEKDAIALQGRRNISGAVSNKLIKALSVNQ